MTSSDLTLRIWDESEWLRSKDEYSSLLVRSPVDQLFHSWDWLTLWWKYFGRPAFGERLQIHAAYDDGALVGVLPVVVGQRAKRQFLRVEVAYVLGNCLREMRGVPTEYADVVCEPGRKATVLRACLRSVLRTGSHHELSLGWSPAAREWQAAFRADRLRALRYLRVVDPRVAYQADLSAGFKIYADGLSGNARRSLMAARRKLQVFGNVSVRPAEPARMPEVLARLNDLHSRRWQLHAFSGAVLAMHSELISSWASNGRICLSELYVGDKVISVLYDIIVGDKQYNIQMGFDPEFAPKLALGLVHLGYAMEAAAATGIRSYDFLAGEGQKTDYKARFSNRRIELRTMQYLRSPVLAAMYRAYDFAKGFRTQSE
ncbi:MAG: GNAT family N-acetyltransferase [Pseudomonadota bacterium]